MERKCGFLVGVAMSALGMAMTPAQAGEVVVRAPFTTVRVGPGYTQVNAPFTRVQVQQPVYVPAVVAQPARPPEVIHMPAPAPAARAMTHAEFARTFTPVQGTYDVVLLHPDTCCPVRVCFTLPCGCPKKVRVERHELEFDYGDYEVEIRFRRDGRVKVEYND